MPNYTFRCIDKDNKHIDIVYNNITNKLIYSDGTDLFDKHIIENKLQSKRQYETIRLVLGTKCNYNCSYCSQKLGNLQVETTIDDIDIFLKDLDKWCIEPPKTIELWGGEPLVYWKYLKKLIPELRKRYTPDQTRIQIISNGSLLTDEIGDFFAEYLIMYSISYDAYGQEKSRGKDIFDDDQFCQLIVRNLLKIENAFNQYFKTNRHWSQICTVLNPNVKDPHKVIEFIYSKLNHKFPVQVGPLLGIGNNVIMSDDDLQRITSNIIKLFINHHELPCDMKQHLDNFVDLLQCQTKNNDGFAFCSIGISSSIVVDLKSNLYPCQNKMRKSDIIGNANDSIKTQTKINSIKRKTCTYCPCLGICKGGCPLAAGNALVETCRNKFAYCIGLFAGLLYQQLHLKVISIEGPIVRPIRELVQTKLGKTITINKLEIPYYES